MRSILAVLWSMLVVGAPSYANPPLGDNLLGLYTADDGTGLANIDAEVGEFVTLHICLTTCTQPSGPAAWECQLEVPDGVEFAGFNLYCGEFNPEEYPDFAVGTYCHLACCEIVRLGWIRFRIAEPGPQYFYFHPHSSPTIPGQMSYVSWDNPFDIIQMNWSSGREECPVFGINTGPLDCDGSSIAVTKSSWRAVKRLYQ